MMTRLDIAIAKKYNELNPITDFEGMNEYELKEFIRHSIKNGGNRIRLTTEYKKFKGCSLSEAKLFVYGIIGEMVEIFYTGLASTPTSVGIRLKDSKVVISEHFLTHIETGKETRRVYEQHVKQFKFDFNISA